MLADGNLGSSANDLGFLAGGSRDRTAGDSDLLARETTRWRDVLGLKGVGLGSGRREVEVR